MFKTAHLAYTIYELKFSSDLPTTIIEKSNKKFKHSLIKLTSSNSIAMSEMFDLSLLHFA